jgi:hypothetical protein
MSITSPTGAQSPEPPEILENGEFPLKIDEIEQALLERSQTELTGGDNSINAVTTWFSSSGTTYVPSSSAIIYNYGGDGCVDTGASGDVWRGSVNIPHGSTITSMWFNYANEVEDPVDSTIYLRRYRYSGDYDTILFVTGTYTGIGNKTQVTYTVANNVVDGYNYAYVLVWIGRPQQNLCGINLGYTPPPLFLSALPMITK